MTIRNESAALCLSEIRTNQQLIVLNATRSQVIARALRIAVTPWRRLQGLIAQPKLGSEEAILLMPCRAIHTCCMSYNICVYFLSPEAEILHIEPSISPWRTLRGPKGALATLELLAAEQTWPSASSPAALGDRVVFEREQ